MTNNYIYNVSYILVARVLVQSITSSAYYCKNINIVRLTVAISQFGVGALAFGTKKCLPKCANYKYGDVVR